MRLAALLFIHSQQSCTEIRLRAERHRAREWGRHGTACGLWELRSHRACQAIGSRGICSRVCTAQTSFERISPMIPQPASPNRTTLELCSAPAPPPRMSLETAARPASDGKKRKMKKEDEPAALVDEQQVSKGKRKAVNPEIEVDEDAEALSHAEQRKRRKLEKQKQKAGSSGHIKEDIAEAVASAGAGSVHADRSARVKHDAGSEAEEDRKSSKKSATATQANAKRSGFGVWVGNLSFATDADKVRLVNTTAGLLSLIIQLAWPPQIAPSEVVRVHLLLSWLTSPDRADQTILCQLWTHHTVAHAKGQWKAPSQQGVRLRRL